ncbi:hypothetical protein GA0070622_1194 [Micromonospora sediminicola]|uniref:Phage head-tail joining protein n=1 Tax=Micromonospora sediminicola TaxID=946078 RepID=A0A1A9B5B7_9ACTN|nr:DUF6093 family protein [Micromonospora sediminicola]SBT64224.1 hypothetical protein GA0070622_1194 [Micromonospora sediminicola]
MSVDRALARGRRAAERLMVDQCRIQRAAGSTEDDDGNVTPSYTTVYEGRCKVQQQAVQSRPSDAGEASLLMVRRELHLPVAASAGVRAGDRVELTACTYDPDLMGRALVVRDEAAKSLATARRLGVEEVTS